MSQIETGFQYIDDQLKGYDPNFVRSVMRCLNTIDENKEYDGAFSNTVALFIIAKECKYDPQICYGLCDLNGEKFYHAWLELDGKVIDTSIYGVVNFHPADIWETNWETPYIGTYADSPIKYGKFVFEDDWAQGPMAKIEGMLLEDYMKSLPEAGMWKFVTDYMNIPMSRNNIAHLAENIKGVKIERK